MIAQDYTKHPGSIIRINLDGSIPDDNPKFVNKRKWLPEIYQIGVRNPQGMSLSPFDNNIYLTNHGAREVTGLDQLILVRIMVGKFLDGEALITLEQQSAPNGNSFFKTIKYWVPSIAVSAMVIYKGNEFKEWNGDALITSLRDQSLRKIKFKNINFLMKKLYSQEILDESGT